MIETNGLTKDEKTIAKWLDENEDIIEHVDWDHRKKLLKELVLMVEKLEGGGSEG